MRQLYVCRDIEHLGSLKNTQEARVSLSCASGNSYARRTLESWLSSTSAILSCANIKKRMRIGIDYWADSSKGAHTVKKCSLVHKIIQHVEYPALMARVTKIAEQDIAHLGNSLRQQSRVTLSSADSLSVCGALRLFRALQTSRVLIISTYARSHMH